MNRADTFYKIGIDQETWILTFGFCIGLRAQNPVWLETYVKK